MRLLLTILSFSILLPLLVLAQQHPIAFGTKADFIFVKNSLQSNALLKQSYADIQASVDVWIDKDVDVPLPKDAAGGYTHDKHKLNYLLMYNSGLLYQITGKKQYALLVKKIFLKYAELNPTLKNHPQATSASPGRIFWQALNDANWLMYAGLAFDCIHDYLTPNERKLIIEGAFEPEVNFFTKELKDWFNLIHNHAVWACAGVGMVGIATNNDSYVQMALKGTNKDGKAGFLAHLDGLFSPDGYYAEGPYYTRYAVLPFYMFANALNNYQPSLQIFKYRNNILQKALHAGLQQTDLNGGFYTYNDALKEKTFVSNELVEALSIAWNIYGSDKGLLPVAKKQNRVTLSKGGALLGFALQNKQTSIPKFYTYESVEYKDGADGKRGGVTLMRSGKGDSLASLLVKYSSHGLSHGHYDKLNINFYNGYNEILTDYGAVRYIGIEQKYGGRYLAETKMYASQTIAHNTIVVDETSHFNGIESESEKYFPEKKYSSIGSKNVQVISTKETNAYKDVALDRTVYLLKLPTHQQPVIVDIFKTQSNNQHQYDLPFHYNGQLMNTNFAYQYNKNTQTTVGKANGYQYLWKEAEASIQKEMAQVTFLNDRTFYTISTDTKDSTNVIFARIGANDINYNLRREPAIIFRRKAAQSSFVTVVEPHGHFDPIVEISTNTYSSIKSIRQLQNNDAYTVVEIMMNNIPITIFQANNNSNSKATHSITIEQKKYSWIGPFYVLYNNQPL